MKAIAPAILPGDDIKLFEKVQCSHCNALLSLCSLQSIIALLCGVRCMQEMRAADEFISMLPAKIDSFYRRGVDLL